MFRVSRTTVRSAINELQNEGYIFKRQGSGTFVASNSYEDCHAKLQSFSKDISKKGGTLRSTLISIDLIIPSAQLKRALETDADEPILRIQRLRYIDGLPSIYTNSYLPKYVYNRVDFEGMDFDNGSLYDYLEAKGFDFESGEEVVEVSTATSLEASLLQIDPGSVVAINKRKIFDKAGKFVEYSVTVTRGDSYRLLIKLQR